MLSSAVPRKENAAMCMNCGCGKPNDDHGDELNITQRDLDRAAEAARISTDEAAQNIMDCCRMIDASGAQQRSNQ
jgi:hypothetical protein